MNINRHIDRELRRRLVEHIEGGHAYSSIDKVINHMPFEKTGIVPDGLPYSFYQQLYHIRISQLDILDYCRNENYQSPDWPKEYWPEKPAPADIKEWNQLIQKYLDEREELCDYISDPANDLFDPFPANPDHNLFREAQLIIEHTSYHTGQLYILYRLLKEIN